MRKIKKIIILSFVLSFFVLSPALSIKLPIGEQCTSNSECESGDCEGSTKKDSKGNSLSFCDCDELDLSITGGDSSQDCADRYGGTKDDWTCKDGADATWDLDYCLHNKDVNKTKSPISPKDPSFIDHILDPSVVLSTKEFKDIKPDLQTTLPGLELSEVVYIEKTTPSGQQGTYLLIPYLGEYLMAFYRYSVVVASILTVIFIIIGGLQWTISGGSPEKIKSAQKKIVGALSGLIIALLSYILLYTINPNLVKFKDFEILFVEGISIEEVLMSKTPGDGGDWEDRHPGKKISYLQKYLPNNLDTIKKIFLFKPEIAYANSVITALIPNLKKFYQTHPQDYTKLNASLKIDDTKLPKDYIQKGACLGWPTINLYGNKARLAALTFARYLKETNIVSYAFYGRGAPCAKEKNNRSVEAMCNDTEWGRFECTTEMKRDLSNKNISLSPWDLEYCLDCSGFAHTIFKCGAQKGIEAKTMLLFSCDAERVRKYQPIPKSETIPGDIVGYKKQKKLGIEVGHVMICTDYGCNKIIHVHGPQAYIKSNEHKAVSEEDETYLKKLLQEKLETIRVRRKTGKWKHLTKEMENYIYKSRQEDGTLKRVKNGTVILPEESIIDMQKRTGFFFEYRRIATLDYKNISSIPLPKCDNILKYSLCSSKGLAKINACQ